MHVLALAIGNINLVLKEVVGESLRSFPPILKRLAASTKPG